MPSGLSIQDLLEQGDAKRQKLDSPPVLELVTTSTLGAPEEEEISVNGLLLRLEAVENSLLPSATLNKTEEEMKLLQQKATEEVSFSVALAKCSVHCSDSVLENKMLMIIG